MAKTKTATKKTPAKTANSAKAGAKKAPAAKAPKATMDKAPAYGKSKTSAIDAAVQVLASSKQAMNCKELVEAMAAKKLWTSPGGKTPHATLYSAILREIQVKGKEARFKKTERGKFAANA
jgi:Tfp pilus assembly protein PilW